MSILGFIIGVLTGLGLSLSIIPLLGWLNWLNIPVAVVGLILSMIGTSKGKHRFFGIVGMIINSIIIMLGMIRLCLGGGII